MADALAVVTAAGQRSRWQRQLRCGIGSGRQNDLGQSVAGRHRSLPGRVCDGLGVWTQIALGGHQRSVPGDLPEHVDRHTGIGHPGKGGAAQVVTAQVFVTELCHDLVPVGRVPQHRCGDPTAARACGDAHLAVVADGIEALLDQRTSSTSGTARARLRVNSLLRGSQAAGALPCGRDNHAVDLQAHEAVIDLDGYAKSPLPSR